VTNSVYMFMLQKAAYQNMTTVEVYFTV